MNEVGRAGVGEEEQVQGARRTFGIHHGFRCNPWDCERSRLGRRNRGWVLVRYTGRRLEMPIFEGENPDDWIFGAERYFTVNQLTKEEKIESMALCFEAAALAWFQWESRRRGIRSWEGLKQGILGRLRST